MLLALTGGIACGKSEVAREIASLGGAVLDTDIVAHELMAPGGAAYAAVVERFGREILRADATIDRRRLGERVFADPAERAALNERVHPHVRKVWQAWSEEQRAAGRPAVCVVPLLYEIGKEKDFDAVLCVIAPLEDVQRRLRERGWSPEEAQRRIDALWPMEEKAKKADYVLVNDGTLDALKEKTKQIWELILRKEHRTV